MDARQFSIDLNAGFQEFTVLAFIRYWLPVFFVVSAIFYFSSLPPDEIPHFSFPAIDKIQHFIAYLCLGFAMARALTWRKRNHPKSSTLWREISTAALLGILYGITDEFHQSFTPGRSVEALDWLADSLGAISGALLVIPYRNWVATCSLKQSPSK